MANKKHKGSHKLAFPIGMLITILAAIGLVTVVVSGVKGIDAAIEKGKGYEEYEKMLTPVVLIAPDTFDDITKADMSQLIEISIWSLIKSDVSPDTYEVTGDGILIPKADVEKQFVALFGTEVTPVHSTIEGYGMAFVYDSAKGTYTVPLTGVTPLYTPDVIEKTVLPNSIVLTVACIPGDAWEQGENGEMKAPTPDKHLKITLREKDGVYYISAIQNTSTPEIATTEKQAETTTQNLDLLGQAEVVASETSTVAETESESATE